MLIKVLKPINKLLPEGLRLSLLPYYRRLLPSLSNIMFLPTLECNYTCAYCLFKRFVPPELKSCVYSSADWIRVFAGLPASSVTITGGEPLIYPDITSLVDNFPRKHLISSLVTNLSLNLEKLFALKRREFRIMASFHPSMVGKEQFLSNLQMLKKNGFKNVTVNFVAYPPYLKDIAQLKRYFEQPTGFYFRVDTFKDPVYNYSCDELALIRGYKEKGIIARDRTEGYSFGDFSSKVCKAGSRLAVLVQNGNAYSCIEGLYYSEFAPYKDKHNKKDAFYLGNVFKGDFKFLQKHKLCHSGCAELCDIELAGVRSASKRDNQEGKIDG
jgi:MoaA/NifB/PqqE/SkfB family radical SAM enzyme